MCAGGLRPAVMAVIAVSGVAGGRGVAGVCGVCGASGVGGHNESYNGRTIKYKAAREQGGYRSACLRPFRVKSESKSESTSEPKSGSKSESTADFAIRVHRARPPIR